MSKQPSDFAGFTPETVDFLWGIRMNNNREWFLANKKQYTDTLYEPMKALGAKLFTPFLDKPGNLLKVSRIYRDARMHHPLPYKESLWICIRQDVQWWAENPCLFFEINPEGMDYGFFFWKPRPEAMRRFRRELAAEPTPFLTMLEKVEAGMPIPVTAQQYKHPEKWEDPRLERFFLWKNQIGCILHEDFSENSFGPELAQRVGETFERLMPLYEYFNRYKTE